MLLHEWWVYALAALVSVIGVGRIVRLITYDKFPPMIALRERWIEITHDGPWSQLVKCGFCLSVWITPISWAWAWASNLHWSWWAAHLLVTCMYLSAILVAYDQPD